MKKKTIIHWQVRRYKQLSELSRAKSLHKILGVTNMNLFVAFCFARINKGGVRNDKEISRFNRIRKT